MHFEGLYWCKWNCEQSILLGHEINIGDDRESLKFYVFRSRRLGIVSECFYDRTAQRFAMAQISFLTLAFESNDGLLFRGSTVMYVQQYCTGTEF